MPFDQIDIMFCSSIKTRGRKEISMIDYLIENSVYTDLKKVAKDRGI